MNDTTLRIIRADFECSVVEAAKIITSERREAAFIGRSNVGKSSLINQLVGQKRLARTSSTPGRTQALNYFPITIRAEKEGDPKPKDSEAYFVDLPGFGFARVSSEDRKNWGALVEDYLATDPEKKLLLLLVDTRRGLEDAEHWILENAQSPLLVVGTKADKFTRNERRVAQQKIAADIGIDTSDVFLTGIGGKEPFGFDELRRAILLSLLGDA